MIKLIKNKFSGVSKSIVVLLLFFFSSLFQLIPISIFNMNINKLTSNETLILTLFSDTILLIILFILYRKTLIEDFKKFKNNLFQNMDCGIKCWFIGLIVMVVSNLIINLFIHQASAGNEETVQALIKSSSILSIITVGVIAPIIEELTFRKSFRDIFKKKVPFILISSLVFGGLHVVLSLTSAWDLFYLIPYCSLGAAFGYMYYKTDNIYTPIVMHMFHNIVLTSLSILGAVIII